MTENPKRPRSKLCKFCESVKLSPVLGTRDYCTTCGIERGLPT